MRKKKPRRRATGSSSEGAGAALSNLHVVETSAQLPASVTAKFAGNGVEPVVGSSETAHNTDAIGANAVIPAASCIIGAVIARTD